MKARSWKNVTTQLEIELTDEMRDELGLFDDAERLQLTIKHSGYYDPGNPFGSNDNARPPEADEEIHSIEGDIENEEGEKEPLSAEQIEIILDGGEAFDEIFQKLGGE